MNRQQRRHPTKATPVDFERAISMMALRDEFGFGVERMERFFKKCEDIRDSIRKGYLSVEDIRSTLKEELKRRKND